MEHLTLPAVPLANATENGYLGTYHPVSPSVMSLLLVLHLYPHWVTIPTLSQEDDFQEFMRDFNNPDVHSPLQVPPHMSMHSLAVCTRVLLRGASVRP